MSAVNFKAVLDAVASKRCVAILQPAKRVVLALVSCSAYWTLRMEATCSSETSVDFQLITSRCIPEDVIFMGDGS
jgi:hypothetical protein